MRLAIPAGWSAELKSLCGKTDLRVGFDQRDFVVENPEFEKVRIGIIADEVHCEGMQPEVNGWRYSLLLDIIDAAWMEGAEMCLVLFGVYRGNPQTIAMVKLKAVPR